MPRCDIRLHLTLTTPDPEVNFSLNLCRHLHPCSRPVPNLRCPRVSPIRSFARIRRAKRARRNVKAPCNFEIYSLIIFKVGDYVCKCRQCRCEIYYLPDQPTHHPTTLLNVVLLFKTWTKEIEIKRTIPYPLLQMFERALDNSSGARLCQRWHSVSRFIFARNSGMNTIFYMEAKSCLFFSEFRPASISRDFEIDENESQTY